MSTEIITAIISAITTLIVSFGTWQVSMRREREKTAEDTKRLFESYRDELRNRIEGLQDDITNVNSTVQQHLSILDLKIDTLSDRVDKHNNVIERTYELEKKADVQCEQIRELREKIG